MAAAATSGARSVKVELGPRSYSIDIQTGMLRDVGEKLKKSLNGRRVLVVTDRSIGPVFGPVVARSLQQAGFDGSLVELPPGEAAKCLKVAECLYDRCFDAKLDRGSCLLALGGGVIGDLTGFVAATFMRGIDFVQVPTTLLAMVDASVGGKTAIDHPLAKNAIGAFHQPRAVLIDPLVLNRLPERELRAGLAEVIKYGVIQDVTFFAYLEENLETLLKLDQDALATIVERSCQIKAEIVGSDEREEEGGSRALLNYGHTFAHAIEACLGFKGYLHGEAVAIGMALAAKLSVKRGLLDPVAAQRIVKLLERAGLPVALKESDPKAEELHKASHLDKKVRDGKLRFVLAHDIGKAKLHADVPEADALEIWKSDRIK